MQKGRENKSIMIRKKNKKLPLFVEDMIVEVENPKNLQIIN